ncbi:5'-3' exoribonuclease 4 [Asimina triloba]
MAILKPYDIKPFPVLWHEDSGGRRQQAKDRRQVQGAISGPLLGEAAHRLLRNSLQVKSNNNAGLLDSPYQNFSNNMINKPRPAGPFGYEGGFTPDPNYYSHGHQHHIRGMIHPSRSAPSSHEFQGSRPSLRQERLPQEQVHDMRGGMLNLTIEDGTIYHQQQQYGMMPRMPNIGPMQHPHQHVRNTPPPPRPPTDWIDKPVSGNMGNYYWQESAPPGGYERQVRKVYQPRTRPPQCPSDYGYH